MNADAVKLYQFPPAWDLPNPSPFCMKLEVFMRLAEIPYEIVTMPDPRKAPKGKLPMIEHGGRRIPDSQFCLAYLAETFAVDLDAGLSEADRATAFAFQKICDEHFYWHLMYHRWEDERVWPVIKAGFFGNLPPLIGPLLAEMIRRGVSKAIYLQGTGRHSRAEIYGLAKESLDALAAYLADKPYFMGDRPTKVDATIYANVANAALVPFDTELQRAARAHDNLIAYCARMKARCWPEES